MALLSALAVAGIVGCESIEAISNRYVSRCQLWDVRKDMPLRSAELLRHIDTVFPHCRCSNSAHRQDCRYETANSGRWIDHTVMTWNISLLWYTLSGLLDVSKLQRYPTQSVSSRAPLSTLGCSNGHTHPFY